MPLKSLRATNFGPFVGDTINFESDVTVITGANDTGKSSLLRLLKLICTKTDTIEMTELDVNSDRATDLGAKWTEDPHVTATAIFDFPSHNNWQAEVNYLLAPGLFRNSTLKMQNYSGPLHGRRESLPNAVLVDLGNGPQIREQIPLASPNADELKLMTIAFGPGFKPTVLKDMSQLRYNRTIAEAESRLNSRLNQFLPPTLNFNFRLKSYIETRETIFVSMEDQHGGFTELSRRGKGIQVAITLLGHLASENYQAQETLLLIDEPETHLHADAQHALRGALEKLAATTRFQIVYATHSPCMVNTMRPKGIRLLTRTTRGDRAITVVDNTPFGAGFGSVRSSLGISPADSLLYAPITIMVEGKTEVLCLPILLKRLSEELKTGFEDVSSLLAQTVLIDAEGCGNIAYLCRLAKSHGAKVLVYVDGDQLKRWEQQLQKEAPLLLSKEGGEFEQIITPERYFEALSRHYKDEGITVALSDYQAWEAKANLPDGFAFTKRVARWFTDELKEREPRKAEVMRDAVEQTPLNEIDLDGLKRLLAAMSVSLDKSKS